MPIADGGPWMLARRGTAFNSFTNIVAETAAWGGFRVITGAHVLQLVWSGDQKKVTEVIYRDRATGSEHRLRPPPSSWPPGPWPPQSSCSIRPAPISRRDWGTATGSSADTCTIIPMTGGWWISTGPCRASRTPPI